MARKVQNTLVNVTLFAIMVAGSSACMVTARGPHGGTSSVGIEFVAEGPPRDRVEEVTVSPGADYVWIGGNWRRDGSTYAWTAGRWERPEAGYHTWVPGHWDHEDRGYFFVSGHWAK